MCLHPHTRTHMPPHVPTCTHTHPHIDTRGNTAVAYKAGDVHLPPADQVGHVVSVVDNALHAAYKAVPAPRPWDAGLRGCRQTPEGDLQHIMSSPLSFVVTDGPVIRPMKIQYNVHTHQMTTWRFNINIIIESYKQQNRPPLFWFDGFFYSFHNPLPVHTTSITTQ